MGHTEWASTRKCLVPPRLLLPPGCSLVKRLETATASESGHAAEHAAVLLSILGYFSNSHQCDLDEVTAYIRSENKARNSSLMTMLQDTCGTCELARACPAAKAILETSRTDAVPGADGG